MHMLLLACGGQRAMPGVSPHLLRSLSRGLSFCHLLTAFTMLSGKLLEIPLVLPGVKDTRDT